MAGALASLMGSGAGSEAYHARRDETHADLLVFIIGIGYLICVFRGAIIQAARKVAGTVEPPVVQPAMTPADQVQATAARPWKMAGWLAVALLCFALLIPCGLAVGPIFSYRQAESEMGTLTIEYDNNKAPVQEIRVRGGNLLGERVFPVDSMPFRIRLAPGHYTLAGTMTVYEDSGQRMALVQPVTFSILKQKETRLNLGPSGVE